MKQGLIVYSVEILLSILCAYFFNDENINGDYLTTVWLISLIIGTIGCLGGVVGEFFGDKNFARSLFIGSGLLILTGIAVCTNFPMTVKLNP